MKKTFANFYQRLRYAWQLLTAKSFILLVHQRPKSGRPGNKMLTNMKDDEYVACILKEAGTHIDVASKSASSLINELGLKGSDE